MSTLVDAADATSTGAARYTHLQRAQPIYLSHHLLAWFWMPRATASVSPPSRPPVA